MKLLATVFLLPAMVLLNAAYPELSGSTPAKDSTQARLYERGKRIFVNRCATCHDQDASKKLRDGTTLVGRLALSNDREARLGTRLKNAQERQAVMMYMDDLVAHWRSSHAGQKQPGSIVAPR